MTIVEGDPLLAIAARCNTTLDALMANPGISPLALRIGDTVFIAAV